MNIERYLKVIMEDFSVFGSMLFYSIIMIILLIFKKYSYFFDMLIGIIILYLVISLVRIVYFKHRPVKMHYNNIFDKIDSSSFPSMHSARAVFLAGILMTLFNNVYISITIIIVTIMCLYSRIYLKKHYPIDVIAGMLLGLLLFGLLRWVI